MFYSVATDDVSIKPVPMELLEQELLEVTFLDDIDLSNKEKSMRKIKRYLNDKDPDMLSKIGRFFTRNMVTICLIGIMVNPIPIFWPISFVSATIGMCIGELVGKAITGLSSKELDYDFYSAELPRQRLKAVKAKEKFQRKHDVEGVKRADELIREIDKLIAQNKKEIKKIKSDMGVKEDAFMNIKLV